MQNILMKYISVTICIKCQHRASQPTQEGIKCQVLTLSASSARMEKSWQQKKRKHYQMANKQIISLLSLHFIQELLIIKGLKMRFNIWQGRGIGRGGCSSRGRGGIRDRGSRRGRGSSWVFSPLNFLSFPQLVNFFPQLSQLFYLNFLSSFLSFFPKLSQFFPQLSHFSPQLSQFVFSTFPTFSVFFLLNFLRFFFNFLSFFFNFLRFFL